MNKTGYWTCPNCGRDIVIGASHACSRPASNYNYNWSVSYPPYIYSDPSVLERIAKALEAIAKNTEHLSKTDSPAPAKPGEIKA